MEKRKLNLNKIRLYCLLHNVKSVFDVPCCFNCRFDHYKCRDKNGVKFSYDKDFREFQLGLKLFWKDIGCHKRVKR